MRVACVLIPHFPVALERRDRPGLRGMPVVIGGAPGERKAVLDCSAEARRRGVRPDMPLRQALALCRDAVFIEPRPAIYRAVFAAILDTLERFSPRVQPLVPGRALLDLAGTEQLWPDEEVLAISIRDAVHAVCALSPRVGIADGPFAAQCAAAVVGSGGAAKGSAEKCLPPNAGEPDAASFLHVDQRSGSPSAATPAGRSARILHPCIVPSGTAPSFLARLPVELLPVSAEMRRRLHLLGLHRLGDLAALPFGAVQAQFGTEGARAWRLVSGVDDGRVAARHRVEEPEETLDLPAPTADRAVIERALEVLIGRLLRRPEAGNHLARRASMRVSLENGRAWERTITFQEATADPRALLFALRARLEGLELPAAAVTVSLTLHDLAGERARQGTLFSAHAHRRAQIDEAVARLRASQGGAPVLRVVEVEPWSRIPERHNALSEYN